MFFNWNIYEIRNIFVLIFQYSKFLIISSIFIIELLKKIISLFEYKN